MSDPRGAITLLRWVLRLSPRGFRERDGAEILRVEEERIQARLDQGDEAGARKLVRGAALDLFRCALAEWRNMLMGRGGPMEGWIRDIRYGIRGLMRVPGFTAVAVITIALGIGANTAIFSVVEAVLLRPLPYATPDRLVTILGEMRARGVEDFPISPPDYLDLENGTPALDELAAVTTFRQPLTGDGEPLQVTVGFITHDFFDVLGVEPALGRGLGPADVTPGDPTAAPGTPGFLNNSALLSHGMWQRRFGGDPEVVGRIVELGGAPTEIVGVLPATFRFLMPPSMALQDDVDIWTGMRLDFASMPRNNVFLRAVGRLAPGVGMDRLDEELARVSADLRAMDPTKASADSHFSATALGRDLTADVRPLLLSLMGAVAFVLLIACANVGNLFVVRSASRERELAVRSALGGERSQIFRQVLVEGVLLAFAGGVLGTVLAIGGVEMLVRLDPTNLPRLDGVGVDGRVLGFTAAATIAAALLFGLVPAVQASRPDLAVVLKDRGRTGLRHGQRYVRNLVVVAEVALSLVLLIGAGLMVRSFVELNRVDPGFDAEALTTFQVNPPGAQYTTVESRIAIVDQLQRRFEAMPGVEAVAGGFPMPLDGNLANGRWGTPDAQADPSQFRQADYHFVLPGYFEAMGTDIVDGRPLHPADQADSTAVVVVDRTLAEQAFPGRSAVGERILVRVTTAEPEFVTIVGVAEPRRHGSLTAAPNPTIYFTDRFVGGNLGIGWAVRTAGGAVTLDQVRAAVAEIDPNAPVSEMRSMSDRVAEGMAPTRFALVLISVFSGLALVLASVGLYGVLSYAVRLRASEFGVRMAFGAERGRILRMVVGQGLALAGAGIAAGVGVALIAGGAMESLLYGVEVRDPITFVGIPLLFAAVAGLASGVPALRATRVDPARSLREE